MIVLPFIQGEKEYNSVVDMGKLIGNAYIYSSKEYEIGTIGCYVKENYSFDHSFFPKGNLNEMNHQEVFHLLSKDESHLTVNDIYNYDIYVSIGGIPAIVRYRIPANIKQYPDIMNIYTNSIIDKFSRNSSKNIELIKLDTFKYNMNDLTEYMSYLTAFLNSVGKIEEGEERNKRLEILLSNYGTLMSKSESIPKIEQDDISYWGKIEAMNIAKRKYNEKIQSYYNLEKQYKLIYGIIVFLLGLKVLDIRPSSLSNYNIARNNTHVLNSFSDVLAYMHPTGDGKFLMKKL